MAEVGFPGQHTTTTVTSSTNVQTNIRFDAGYLRTAPGMLKAAQVLLSLLGFISVQCSNASFISQGQYFCWVSMIAFWFTGILLGFYLFHIVEKFYKIPWLKLELVFCALWTLLYLIAASIAVSMHISAYTAAGVFGFAAMFVYGADAFLKYRGVRGGGLAQGDRVVSKQTTVVNTRPEGY